MKRLSPSAATKQSLKAPSRNPPAGERIFAAGCVVYRRSRGFLLLKAKHFWEFPKGRVDNSDETMLATAIREVKEETGLATLTIIEGFHEHEDYRVSGQPKTVEYWLATTTSEPAISNEHRGYAWCSADEALKLLSYPSKKKLLQKAVKFLRERELLKDA